MNKKITVGTGVLLVAAIALVIYFASRPDQGDSPPVRIGYLNIVASLPLFIAEDKGFLEAEGLTYEAITMASSNQLVDAVVAGNLDCYIESSAVPVLAMELQSPGKLKVFSVSEITPQTPFDALLVKEDSAIKALSDLAGKKLGVFPGSTATNLLKKYLGDQGIDTATITFVPMPPPNHLAALVAGSVDAIHAYEPTTAIAIANGGVRQLFGSVYAEMLSPNPQGVAAIGATFLEEHPDAAQKVIRALERAMAYMREHDADTRNLLVRRMKLSTEAAERCVFLYMLPHAQIDAHVVQRYADMLTDLGELDAHVDVGKLLYSR